jgi:hypothetical protein
MPAIVVCATCQTKLKVPENTAAKALKCPKCKGVVPIAPPKKEPPKKAEDEFEVNEAVDEKDEEFEVNESAEDEEEHEVNEAADEEDEEADDEEEADESSALVELGFGKGADPYKKAKIADDAKKAIEKSFAKKEAALWAGKPVAAIIESKAWIGFVVGGIAILVGLSVCLGTGVGAAVAAKDMGTGLLLVAIGVIFGGGFGGVGLLAIIFRKNIGGNVRACYVLTNKRAYVYDGSNRVRAFTPEQLTEMKTEESSKFPGAGDLIFAYDFMGDAGVQVNKEDAQRYGKGGGGQHSTAVGFLAIENLDLVKRMVNEVLVEPHLDKIDAKRKAKKKKAKKKFKPFGG